MTGPAPYPLTWPEGLPRWQRSRETGQFKTALSGAMKNVQDSLRRFGQLSGKPVSDVVISSNVTLGVAKPADPGVAVWFRWEENDICIPVDRYASVEANLQAIHHVLEARNTELRHGTLALVRASLRGFQALPAPMSWREVLGISTTATINGPELDAFYRKAARVADDDVWLAEINMARDRARKELGL